MYCFSFNVVGHCDTAGADAESVEHNCGKTLLGAVQPGLAAAQFKCEPVEFENGYWRFKASKNGTIYQVGGQVECGIGRCRAQVFIRHDRGLLDRLLSRNVPAPQNYSEKSLRDALKALTGVSDVQESRSFEKFEADKVRIAAIQQ